MKNTMKKFATAVAVAILVVSMATAAAFAAPVEVHSFEDLAAISSTPLEELNGDGGRKATLTVDMIVTEDLRVLCGSDVDVPTGTVLRAGSVIYVWLCPIPGKPAPAPAPVSNDQPAPTPVSDDRPAPTTDLVAFANLSQYGKVMQRDSLWMGFTPYQDCRVDLAVLAVFDTDDFSNEVIGTEGQAAIGQLRQGGHYILTVRELFREFVPESDDDLSLLAHPKIGVEAGPVWTPEGRTVKNYYIVLAADWCVATNTEVLYNSDVRRAAGEVIPAGGKMLINVKPLPKRGGDDTTGDSGGGGGCNAGMGLPALAAVAIFLKRKTA